MLDRSDLRPSQNRLVDFIKARDFSAAWVFPGGGKTVSALTAYSDLLKGLDVSRILVVGPLRVARKVWNDEIQNWAHLNGLTTSKIIGDLPIRWRGLKTGADIHLINREQIPWLHAQFIQNKKQVRRFPWDAIILDESQSFKAQSSRRWKCMRDLRRLCQRMTQLTGTPAPEGYGDLWGQMFLLDRGQRLGATEEAYRHRWFDAERKEDNYVIWTLKEGADLQIQKAVSDIVMVVQDDVDAPPVLHNLVRVDLPPAVLKQYRKFERDALIEFNQQKITAVNAGAVAGKLLQFANGAVYHDREGNWTEVHDEKIKALLELVDGALGPMIVVYEFRHDLARILAALKKTSKRVDVLKTEESEERWNREETDVLVLHPASAGHGLNLQHAGSEMLVWFGLTPKLEHYDQANARLIGGLRRVGRNVVIHHIIADETRDLAILEMLKRKDGTQVGLMKALAVGPH